MYQANQAKQAGHKNTFILLLRVFELCYHDWTSLDLYWSDSHCKCSAVLGELPRKFTTSDAPMYVPMQFYAQVLGKFLTMFKISHTIALFLHNTSIFRCFINLYYQSKMSLSHILFSLTLPRLFFSFHDYYWEKIIYIKWEGVKIWPVVYICMLCRVATLPVLGRTNRFWKPMSIYRCRL